MSPRDCTPWTGCMGMHPVAAAGCRHRQGYTQENRAMRRPHCSAAHRQQGPSQRTQHGHCAASSSLYGLSCVAAGMRHSHTSAAAAGAVSSMATLLASKPASASEPSLWPLCSDAVARPGCRNPSCMASGAVPAVSGEARASRSCLCFCCAGLSVAAEAAGLSATSLSEIVCTLLGAVEAGVTWPVCIIERRGERRGRRDEGTAALQPSGY